MGNIIDIGVESGNITSINTSNPSAKWRFQEVGGIAGGSFENSSIYNCYSNINISATNSEYYSSSTKPFNTIGGIVGSIGNSIVTNCYNSGKIEGYKATSNEVGGINGRNNNSIVENCYNYGEVLGSNSLATYNMVAGIVGCNGYSSSTKGTITNSYCTTTSAQCSSYYTSINTKYTTGIVEEDELKTYAQILNGNVTEDEKIWLDDISKINNGYPILKWQIPEYRK